MRADLPLAHSTPALFEKGVVLFLGAFLLMEHRECCSVHLGPEVSLCCWL